MPKKPKYRRGNRKPKTTRARQSLVPKTLTQSQTVYEEPELPTWTKQEDVVDYLSEDDQMSQQRWACVSMLSLSKWRTERQREEAIDMICNKEGFDVALASKIIDSWSDFSEPKRGFKIRGVFATYPEAKKRSAFLQRTHKNHNVAITSVGYWVPFDPDPDKVTDQNYMERELNELKEGYMKNREKGKEHFREQAAMKAHRARVEGSKWGQEQLLKRKETRQEVEHRFKAAEEDIAQYTEKIDRAKNLMEQAQKKLEYMKEHPETVLEEEETPIDMDNVPEEVLKEIQNKVDSDDSNRLLLTEIENQRKRPNLGQQAQQQSLDNVDISPTALQQALGQNIQEPLVSDASNAPDVSNVSNTVSKNVSNATKSFGDDVILPHQAREEIKKVDAEFKKNHPNPLKSLKKKVI